MNTYSTPLWGYKVLSNGIINVHYKFSPPINFADVVALSNTITHTVTRNDGSVNIYYNTNYGNTQLLEQLVTFFENKTAELITTPKFTYNINPEVLPSLRRFSLTLEGSIAILLGHDNETKQLIGEDWKYINQPCGGLFLAPYTLLLQKEYPRIVHPISNYNTTIRALIEKKTALFARAMIGRFEEAHPGYESLAFASYLQEKTKLSQDVLSAIMIEKLEKSPRTYNSSLFMYF